MRGQTIGGFLTRLAARLPAPGGGATAALHAAQAAALVGMVARYSDGARFAEHADEIATILTGADRLRLDALRLAEADAAAFSAVAVIEVAADTVGLAERLIPIGNQSVITDVAAAAEAARAAATTARVNIEINLGGIADAESKADLLASVHAVDLVVERAEKVTAAVRAELSV